MFPIGDIINRYNNVELFDITGKAMTGWVIVKEPGCRDDSSLKAWVDQGAIYSLTLPQKE